MELPTVRSYGDELIAAVREGAVAEELVDRALRRVLLQKCELGLLDPKRPVLPAALDGVDPDRARGTVDLDPPRNRALARLLAERSCVLLANPGDVLPLGGTGRIAVVGPRADDPLAMLGCYSFPSHVGVLHPEMPMGISVPTVLESLREEFPGAGIDFAEGCDVDGTDASGIAQAVELAAGADVCVAVLGDRAGLFGRGTSGEGCDAADLSLPGIQAELLDALLDTGTPVVLVLLTGRTYALGGRADRLAGSVQAFFPGEEGGSALAGVLSGRVNPSGRLPIGVPNGPGGQPWTYLQPPLGRVNGVSNLDPTPLHPFGHGLSYTSFDWEAGAPVPAELPTDGATDLELTVRNSGERDGAEVVQLYVHDPVAQTTRPESRLIGYARVPLAAGRPGGSASASMRTSCPSPGRAGAGSSSPATSSCASPPPATTPTSGTRYGCASRGPNAPWTTGAGSSAPRRTSRWSRRTDGQGLRFPARPLRTPPEVCGGDVETFEGTPGPSA